MELKRIALAIGLSCAIFFGWNYLSLQMGWVQPQPDPATRNATAPVERPAEPAGDSAAIAGDPTAPGEDPAAPVSDPSATPKPVFTPTDGRLVTVETPLYKAVFHSSGGILRQFYLKKYHTSLKEDSPLVNLVNESAAGQAPMGLLVNGVPTWTGIPWALEGDNLVLDAGGSGVLRFIAEVDDIRVVRELTFSGSGYTIDENVLLTSASSKVGKIAFTFGAGPLGIEETPSPLSRLWRSITGGPAAKPEESNYNLTRFAWLQNGKFDDSIKPTEIMKGNMSWVAVMNNYFMGAVSMSDENATARGTFNDGVYHVFIGKTGIPVSSAGTTVNCTYYLGPKEAGQLGAAPNELLKALDYGLFSVIAKPLVWLLQFFYTYVHNYGVAILLMTVLIKIVFWPLSQKSYKSMQQMKQLQPLMAKIREKHAGDKEAMNREVMQLYKTYKVNPAGGCLPILVQIPVFFGLYQALLNAIELRHAPFIPTLPFTDKVWLADLAAPDPYFITPLVMGATMFLQQKMTPTPGDPTQAKVMLLMPVVFTALFINFSSGLVVYWLINNVISIGQQWMQLRRTS